MRRAGIIVDVQTVRLVVYDIGVCAKGIEHRLCNVPKATIGAIQTNFNTSERIDTQRNQITHVTITACHIIYRTANMLMVGKGQLRSVLIKNMELTVNISLD